MKKIPYEDARSILDRFELGENAGELITPEYSPLQVMEKLLEEGLLADYVNFVGHALPPREGICWALSVQDEMGVNDISNARATRQRVREWVKSPEEKKRRTLLETGDKLGTQGPSGWLCYAVAWNGSGSIAASSGPVVLPPAYLHAKAILGAIALIPCQTQEDIKVLLQTAHRCALDVANGAWPGVNE
ncbi:DUF6931 family protein [Flexibacterium corallicola]|uniref:DUF6931 family protein n=1 Tax=Flexibacterium corallicola TaxID=3037259 RepID=UPI00286F9D3C|nr:hypothetical protein [Pseudovibrio sp. M1P-2-3]